MQLGRHLRELWRLRLGVAVSFALALFIAVSSIDHVSLLPPKRRKAASWRSPPPRRACWSTSPRSEIIDLRTDTYDLHLADHARRSARQRHGQRARCASTSPAAPGSIRLRIEAVGADHGRRAPLPERAGQREARQRHPALDRPVPPRHPGQPDGARSSTSPRRPRTRRRRSAWPTAPSTGCATTSPRWPSARAPIPRSRSAWSSSGRARGGVINNGIGLQIALLSFIFVFTLSCCAVLFLSRVRRGWARRRPTRRRERRRPPVPAPAA